MPAAELLPELEHPVTGESLASIAARLQLDHSNIAEVLRKRTDISLADLGPPG